MTADPRAVEIITEALRNEAKHYPGDDESEDRCCEHEDECLRAHVHQFIGAGDDIQSVAGAPERFAEAAVDALAAAGWSLLPPGGQTRDLMRDMELVAAQLDRTGRGRAILSDPTSQRLADAYHEAAMRVREALATHRPPSDTPGEPA